VSEIRAERSEQIVVTDVETATRNIVVKEPIMELVETTRNEQRVIATTVVEARGKGFGAVLKAVAGAAVEHVTSLGMDKHGEINKRMRGKFVETDERTLTETIDVPVTTFEQQVTGYVDRVVDSVKEIVGTSERVVGTKALHGGLPVIELLATLGHAVERYCLQRGPRTAFEAYLARERETVALALDRERGELTALLDRGGSAEGAVVEVLRRCLP
jgi:hypothetical protein